MFLIVGTYRDRSHEIGSFQTLERAAEMLCVYRMAFNNGWKLTIERTK